MPEYTFKCPVCDETQTVIRPMSEAEKPVKCKKDGNIMNRDFRTDFEFTKSGEHWPLISTAAGIHPDQVPEQMAIDRKNGVPTQYIDGDPVLTSKSHRKKYLESRGIYDRNASYGDPTPK